MSLRNPFVNALNDVKNLESSFAVMEDVYTMLNIVDGPESAMRCRAKMSTDVPRYTEDTPLMHLSLGATTEGIA